ISSHLAATMAAARNGCRFIYLVRGGRSPKNAPRFTHDLGAFCVYDEAPTVLDTDVNVALALVPSAVIAAMQTTMIKASITAYSTAVGPSSRFKKSVTSANMLVTLTSFIVPLLAQGTSLEP